MTWLRLVKIVKRHIIVNVDLDLDLVSLTVTHHHPISGTICHCINTISGTICHQRTQCTHCNCNPCDRTSAFSGFWHIVIIWHVLVYVPGIGNKQSTAWVVIRLKLYVVHATSTSTRTRTLPHNTQHTTIAGATWPNYDDLATRSS